MEKCIFNMHFCWTNILFPKFYNRRDISLSGHSKWKFCQCVCVCLCLCDEHFMGGKGVSVSQSVTKALLGQPIRRCKHTGCRFWYGFKLPFQNFQKLEKTHFCKKNMKKSPIFFLQKADPTYPWVLIPILFSKKKIKNKLKNSFVQKKLA